jgi:hypothetical protein
LVRINLLKPLSINLLQVQNTIKGVKSFKDVCMLNKQNIDSLVYSKEKIERIGGIFMGKLINLISVPKPINLNNRKEKLEKRNNEVIREYEELKKQAKDLYKQ